MIKNENLFHNKCVLEVGSGIGIKPLFPPPFLVSLPPRLTSSLLVFRLISVLFSFHLGLCGLLASRFASETFLTDYEDVVLEVLQKNVNLNQGKQGDKKIGRGERRNKKREEGRFLLRIHSLPVSSCHCKKLDWGNETNIGELLKLKPNGFDIIIGSDVVYLVPFSSIFSSLFFSFFFLFGLFDFHQILENKHSPSPHHHLSPPLP